MTRVLVATKSVSQLASLAQLTTNITELLGVDVTGVVNESNNLPSVSQQ